MLIPILPIVLRDGTLRTGEIAFRNNTMDMAERNDLSQVLKDLRDVRGKNDPIILADTEGLRTRSLDMDVLKRIRAKRMKIWLMTSVISVDDIFDIFYVGVESILMPHHIIPSKEVLREINTLSDRCIPVVITEHGRTSTERNVYESVRDMKAMGFHRTAVMETSGIYDGNMWRSLHEIDENIIPYVHHNDPEMLTDLSEIGFTYIIY